ALACAAQVFASGWEDASEPPVPGGPNRSPAGGKLAVRTAFDRPGLHPGRLRLTLAGRITDIDGYALVFRAPRSYTGEDLVELHLPGAPVLVEALLRALCQSGAAGAVPAQPGEFTRRAVLNGRMNLTQAQATLVAIHGHDAADLRVGARLIGGATQAALGAARAALLDLLADIEAGLDFSGEDIEIIADEAVRERLRAAADVLAGEHRLLDPSAGAARRELNGLLPRIALVGATGSGKSTLFNRLVEAAGAAGRDAALAPDAESADVSSDPRDPHDRSALVGASDAARHTTRDVLIAELPFGGGRAVLADLPGVGATAPEEALERAAIDAGLRWARSADILIVLADLTRPALGDPHAQAGPLHQAEAADAADPADWADRADREVLAERLNLAADPRPLAWAWNKLDRLPFSAGASGGSATATAPGVPLAAPLPPAGLPGAALFHLSAQTGAGVADLQRWLEHTLAGLPAPAASIGDLLEHLSAARAALAVAVAAVSDGQELAAVALRDAITALEHCLFLRLSPDQRTEAMLDRLFARFCLGK
ncbi:MAG: hypothetical protein ACREJ2_05045, partial [Planctomycetota bacterium]